MAMIEKADKKPDKITVIYGAYQMARERVSDLSTLKEADAFWEQLKKDNPGLFQTISVSMFFPPRVEGFNIRTKSLVIDTIDYLLDQGLDPDNIVIKGHGNLLDVKAEDLKKIDPGAFIGPPKGGPTGPFGTSGRGGTSGLSNGGGMGGPAR
jgi:hypothetical protein